MAEQETDAVDGMRREVAIAKMQNQLLAEFLLAAAQPSIVMARAAFLRLPDDVRVEIGARAATYWAVNSISYLSFMEPVIAGLRLTPERHRYYEQTTKEIAYHYHIHSEVGFYAFQVIEYASVMKFDAIGRFLGSLRKTDLFFTLWVLVCTFEVHIEPKNEPSDLVKGSEALRRIMMLRQNAVMAQDILAKTDWCDGCHGHALKVMTELDDSEPQDI